MNTALFRHSSLWLSMMIVLSLIHQARDQAQATSYFNPPNAVGVAYGVGDGSFTAFATHPGLSSLEFAISQMGPVFIGQDGKRHLALLSEQGELSFVEWSSNYTMPPQNKLQLGQLAEFGRLNRDQLADVVSVDKDGQQVVIHYFNSDRQVQTSHVLVSGPLVNNIIGLAVGDVSGNGLDDVLLLQRQASPLLYMNNSDTEPAFTSNNADVSAFIALIEVQAMDINDDGLTDFIGLSSDGQRVLIITDSGSLFNREQNFAIDLQSGPMWVGDFNGDGKGDVLQLQGFYAVPGLPFPRRLNLYLHQDNGEYIQKQDAWPVGLSASDLNGVASHRSIAVLDLDGDGKLDILVNRSASSERPDECYVEAKSSGCKSQEPFALGILSMLFILFLHSRRRNMA